MRVTVEEKKDSVRNTIFTVYFHLADGTKLGASILDDSEIVNREPSVSVDFERIEMFVATLCSNIAGRRAKKWSATT